MIEKEIEQQYAETRNRIFERRRGKDIFDSKRSLASPNSCTPFFPSLPAPLPFADPLSKG